MNDVVATGGVSPAYVRERLGHASFELTVGTCGRWLRKRAPGALDILDLDAGKVGAEAPETVAGDRSEASGRSPQVPGLAEREGFEPSVEGLPLHVISRSAAKPPDVTPSHPSCSNDETADEDETG